MHFDYALVERLPADRETEADAWLNEKGGLDDKWTVFRERAPRPVLVHLKGSAGACFDGRRGRDGFLVVCTGLAKRPPAKAPPPKRAPSRKAAKTQAAKSPPEPAAGRADPPAPEEDEGPGVQKVHMCTWERKPTWRYWLDDKLNIIGQPFSKSGQPRKGSEPREIIRTIVDTPEDGWEYFIDDIGDLARRPTAMAAATATPPVTERAAGATHPVMRRGELLGQVERLDGRSGGRGGPWLAWVDGQLLGLDDDKRLFRLAASDTERGLDDMEGFGVAFKLRRKAETAIKTWAERQKREARRD